MKYLTVFFGLWMSSSLALAEAVYPLRFSDYSALSQTEREAIDVASLQSKTQLELDLLYSQLTAGSLPDGAYEGLVKFDETKDNDIERILALAIPSELEDWVKSVGVSLWKGKRFNKEKATLSNRLGLIQRFPAKVYCGQSMLDSRRESIILDYAYGETIPGYIAGFDWPMTRRGLSIRDEIRMVKPGLYLGRAYIQGLYALNFILYNAAEEMQANWSESCR
ncbi:MAG: hypothetical protein NTX25_06345 [Proteobacteria bacterium]|nr:hypothetical protein [Pseudomonadota bacterium]